MAMPRVILSCVVALLFGHASQTQGGVMGSIGAATADPVNRTVAFELEAEFDGNLVGEELSFLALNVQSSMLRGSLISDYGWFRFEPDSGFDPWMIEETFGSLIDPFVFAMISTTVSGDFPVPITSKLRLGRLIFDYGAAGLLDGESLVVNLNGGTATTQSQVFVDFDVNDTRVFPLTFSPVTQTFTLGDDGSNNNGGGGGGGTGVIPEPSSLVIASILVGLGWVQHRRRKRQRASPCRACLVPIETSG